MAMPIERSSISPRPAAGKISRRYQHTPQQPAIVTCGRSLERRAGGREGNKGGGALPSHHSQQLLHLASPHSRCLGSAIQLAVVTTGQAIRKRQRHRAGLPLPPPWSEGLTLLSPTHFFPLSTATASFVTPAIPFAGGRGGYICGQFCQCNSALCEALKVFFPPNPDIQAG